MLLFYNKIHVTDKRKYQCLPIYDSNNRRPAPQGFALLSTHASQEAAKDAVYSLQVTKSPMLIDII